MKKTTALIFLFSIAGIVAAPADDVIKSAMKKYHKPEDAIAKKVGKGEASDAELAELLKAYEATSAATPPKGDKATWVEKNQAVIAAIKKVQAKDATGVSDFKKAINCKACHEVFKGK